MLEVLKSSRFLFIFSEKGQTTSLKHYQKIADFSEKLGLEVYLLDLSWKKHNSFIECALEATKKVHEIVDELHPTEIFFFGFGIGAMIAVEVGYVFQANAMLLCSMPPLFHEELKMLGFFKRYLAKKRIYNSKNNTSFPNENIKVCSFFIYTLREKKKLNKFLETRKIVFKNTKLRFVSTSSSLRRKKYFNAVLEEIKIMVKK